MEYSSVSLKAEYLTTMYQEIAALGSNEREATSLVRHVQTGRIAVKKIIAKEKLEIYKKLKNLNHRNLVPIYEVEDCGEYGMVIEDYISGSTLEDEILRLGRLTEECTRNYIGQLIEVLQVIHENGIIHRDINPKNILISVDGVVKLIDFGIAREHQEEKKQDTTILGTVGYASPEQFGFRQTDVRTDIYAVGVLINVCLTGKLPNQVMYHGTPFSKVIKKSTEIDPDKRYHSIDQLSQAMGNKVQDNEEPVVNEKALPGFRTGVRWKKIVGSVGYGFLLIASVVSISGCAKSFSALLLETIAVLIYVWLGLFEVANYRSWDRKIWPMKKFPKELRIAIRIALWMLILYYGFELEEYVKYTMLGMVRPS